MRIYQTREERRNAGLKHEVTDWLTVSGLLELEAEAQRFALREESSNSHGDDSVATVQLGAELHPLDWFKIESVYEYDTETNNPAWNLPNLKGSLFMDYQIDDNWYMGA